MDLLAVSTMLDILQQRFTGHPERHPDLSAIQT